MNLTGGISKGDPMELGRVEGVRDREEKAEEQGSEEEDWQCGLCEEEWGQIYGLGERCYNCQGFGHYARECPYHRAKGDEKGEKGKSKGKGKGSPKGSGQHGPVGKGKPSGSKGQGKWSTGGDKGKGKGTALAGSRI